MLNKTRDLFPLSAFVFYLIIFSILQINFFEGAMNRDHHSLDTRSFPETVGSGSTPLAPKVVMMLMWSSTFVWCFAVVSLMCMSRTQI